MASPAVHSSGPTPPGLVAGPTPSALLLALRRHWLLALVIALPLSTLAGGAAWMLTNDPQMGASVQVKFETPPPYVLQPISESKEDFERFATAQAQMVLSAQVLDAVLAHPELADLERLREHPDRTARLAWLHSVISVDFPSKSDQMRILVQADEADRPDLIADAVAREFIAESERSARAEREAHLNRWFAEAEKARHELEVLLKDVPKVAVSIPLSPQLEKTREKLREVQDEQKALLAQQKERPNQTEEPAEAEINERTASRLSTDTAYQKLLTERTKAAAKYQEFVNRTTKPEVFGAREKQALDIIEQTLETHRQKTMTVVQAELKQELAAKSRAFNDRLAELARQEKTYQDQLTMLTAPNTPTVPPTNPDSDALLAHKLRLSSRIKECDDQVKRLRPELEVRGRASLVGSSLPLDRGNLRQIIVTASAGLGVFLISLLGVSLWGFGARRVSTPADVAGGLGLKVLGALPRLPKTAEGRLKEPAAPTEMASRLRLYEAVDVIRTLLQGQADSMRTLLITSAVQSEAKTSLASQLAASLARSGQNVLLIDADLRKPTAHKIFDLPMEPGLCEVLRDDVGTVDVVKPTRVGRLWMVAAGDWTPSLTQFLNPESVRKLLDEWRGRFDFVILDSAPVLPVADSLVLARAVDGVIVSVLRDRSSLTRVHAGWQRLEELRVPLLGVVFNDARTEAYQSNYEQTLRRN